MNPQVETQGWLLPKTSSLVLRADDDLLLMDSQGTERGRLAGVAAQALLRHLRGETGGPLLDTLLRASPNLAYLLDESPLPLSPQTLLKREGWGVLFVELTARCNERCLHCYASSGPEQTAALDRTTVEAAIRDAAALGFESIQLTGGEPLLCPFVVDAADLATRLGLGVEIYTNGVLLNDRRYAELREVGVSFAFSLYANDPTQHDAVTRLEGSHALTVAAIQRALAGGSPLRVGVIATRPGDEEQAAAAAQMARDLGVERVHLEVSREVGRGQYAGQEPTWPAGEPAPAGHAPSSRGKAAILPDGWVTPCIFSRELHLGRVDSSGGLRAALQDPALRLDTLTQNGVSDGLRSGCAGLTCGECRVATVLLRPRATVVPCVQSAHTPRSEREAGGRPGSEE